MRRDRGDSGFAMVMSILVSAVVLVMSLTVLAAGVHLDQATGRDRAWNRALAVAEAGIDRAVFEYARSPLYAGTGGVAGVPGGQFEAAVTSPRLGWMEVDATGYVPAKADWQAGRRGAAARRVKAVYGPYGSFKYALFSDSGLEVKNNNATTGDIWANGSIVMKQNSGVFGSVTSATGTLLMENNAAVRRSGGEGGDVHTGGSDLAGKWGLFLSGGAVVEGSAYVRAVSCPVAGGTYNLTNAGSITGNAVAAGSINGTVLGTRTPFNCQPAPAVKTLPEFHFDPDLYVGELLYASAADFQAWADANAAALTGVHKVQDPDPSAVIDLGGKTITGNFTLITNTLIDFNNNAAYTGPADAYVTLVSLNPSTSPPAINIKNNFTIPSPSPAVLVYSTGLIYVKNNATSNGAVYAGAISINNNLDITYDPRVERTVGFGPSRYERVSWQELRVG